MKAHEGQFSIQVMCRAFGVSRSAYPFRSIPHALSPDPFFQHGERGVERCVAEGGRAFAISISPYDRPLPAHTTLYSHMFPDCPDEPDGRLSSQLAAIRSANEIAWLQTRSAELWAGRLPSLVRALADPMPAKVQSYFLTHQACLRYPDFRDLALPIGSGAVESEVKQFKARLASPSTRWSRPAAERMIFLRAAVLDGSFDAPGMAA